MKKLFIIAVLFIAALGTNAQDYNSAKNLMDKNDVMGARTQVDALLAAKPDNVEALYLKGRVYEAIAKDEKLRSSVPDAAMQAFDALKKAYAKSDASNELKLMKLSNSSKYYEPLLGLYSDFYSIGQVAFKNALATQKPSDFEISMNDFINTENVGKYVTAEKIGVLPDLDTAVVLNIGQTAIYAQKEDVSVAYFKRLADANVSLRGYELPYEWLTQYYFDKKQYDNFKTYANKGKQYFPQDPFFNLMLSDYYEKEKDDANMAKNYEELITRFPDSSNYNLYYASFLLNQYLKDTLTADRQSIKSKFEAQIQPVLKKDPASINGNGLYGQYYFIMAADYQSEAKAQKTPKGKEEKNKLARDYSNKAIPYLEAAVTSYEATHLKSDKSKYKTIVNHLIEIYTYLGQPDKAKAYQQKYDTAEGRFNS